MTWRLDLEMSMEIITKDLNLNNETDVQILVDRLIEGVYKNDPDKFMRRDSFIKALYEYCLIDTLSIPDLLDEKNWLKERNSDLRRFIDDQIEENCDFRMIFMNQKKKIFDLRFFNDSDLDEETIKEYLKTYEVKKHLKKFSHTETSIYNEDYSLKFNTPENKSIVMSILRSRF